MKATFIVNPISGRSSKESIVGAIAGSVDMDRYEVTIRFTAAPGHATTLASEAVQSGQQLVVAVGGDGTVNEVARALVGTDAALGIIPCGSGNGLARHLHIPMNPRKAIEILNQGRIRRIDTLTVNGTPCFCTAGVGYDAFVSEEYAKEPTRGLVTYVRKAVENWFDYTPEQYLIETEEGMFSRTALAITCANANQWGNGFHVAPKASLTDGLIDVTIIHPIKPLNALPMPVQILGYSFDKNPGVETFKTSGLTIRRATPAPLHIDGEPQSGTRDITIALRPASLGVLCGDGEV